MSPSATRQIAVVIDCADPDGLSGFWTEALGYERGAWPHEPYVVLVPVSGDGPTLILQRVGEPKSGKNRVHIDLYATDAEAEAERLEGLGATRVGVRSIEEHGSRWIVMQDPQGNEFCVVVPAQA